MTATVVQFAEIRRLRSIGQGPARLTPEDLARAKVRERLKHICTPTEVRNACADAARFVRMKHLVFDAVERAVSTALNRAPPVTDPNPPRPAA